MAAGQTPNTRSMRKWRNASAAKPALLPFQHIRGRFQATIHAPQAPKVAARDDQDAVGNVWIRPVAPPGFARIRNKRLIADRGRPDDVTDRRGIGPSGPGRERRFELA